MSTDVEMADAPKDGGASKAAGVPKEEATPAPKTPSELKLLLVADLKKSVALVEKAVATKESRFIARVLRQTNAIRRRLTAGALHQLVQQTFTGKGKESLAARDRLLHYTSAGKDAAMDVDTTTPAGGDAAAAPIQAPVRERDPLPEVEVFLELLVLIFLLDQQRNEEAVQLADFTVERIQGLTRSTLNLLSARVYFYYSRSYELVGKFDQIRPVLLAAFRTASLRHNDEGQATLLNLLLRNYLEHNLYDQADKLVSKTTFPEQTTSSNQFARYLYYQGRIKAVQLEYSEAYTYLLQAIRKAPQNTAVGFRQCVHKLACIVQLLMGEMPERAIFAQPDLRVALRPYLKLAQAVRVGDLVAYQGVVDTHGATFKADKTYILIQRLRHNVIKTGLRKLNVAYSRISIADVTKRLHFDVGVEDAEFIVAKAIRDGVIDATIDHVGGFIQSREMTDIYSTHEPHAAFHKRISFCLDVHNDAVRAMRFAPDAHKQTQAEAAKAHKERQQQEQELAKELEEDEDEGF